MRGFRIVVCVGSLLVCALCALPLAAQGSGRIEGSVINDKSGSGVGGVTVVVSELGMTMITSNAGAFAFERVPAGSYTLTFTVGEHSASESGVAVSAGSTTTLDKHVDWDIAFAETITVYSASRRRERIVEAPAAVTVVDEEEIEREASHGQIPKLLEFTPGVEATQSGIFDYNLNTRGFNSSLNRRVVVLVDGRNPAVPFLSSQEWSVVSQYMNDLASAEMVRGPSSALYGANAYNGVLNLVTKSPRYSPGGELRLTGGDLATKKGDLRWAGALGSEWYLKLTGSYLASDDFIVSRDLASGGPEYSTICTVPSGTQFDCLYPEVRPLVRDDNEISFGSVRLEKHLANSDFFNIDAGFADARATAIQTGIGRFAVPDVTRTWYRANYTAAHWNFLGYFNDRQGKDQTSLQSGAVTFLDSQNYKLEFQTNWDMAGGKVRLVAGASYGEEDIDSANPQGRQTLMFEPVSSDAQAVFGQVDFDLGDKVKLVLAARYDESSLHDSQFSPKGSLVWSPNAHTSLRFSYNSAFQVANYSEFFLQGDGAPPLNLSPFEAFCAAAGVSCGFDRPVRVLAVGNRNLQVEEITGFEVGYSGILGNKAFLTVDYYNNQLDNFITDLLPNVGTPLGRLNPDFGPYTPPAALPEPFRSLLLATLQGALGPSYFILSNNYDGSPILAAVSYTNFGRVDTQGVDLGLNVYVTPQWRFNATYSWFDFDTKENFAGDPLEPNSPENHGGAGISYVAEKFDFGLNWRWVDDFPWVVGTLFRGTVKSYNTMDLNANYRINDNWEVGVNVANLFDDEHWEAFGGDLIGRRALGHVAYRW